MTQTNKIQETLTQYVLFESLSDIDEPQKYGFETYSEMFNFILTQDEKLNSERFTELTIDQTSLELMSCNGFNFGEFIRNRYEDAKALVNFLLELSDSDDFETQKMEFLKIKMPR